MLLIGATVDGNNLCQLVGGLSQRSHRILSIHSICHQQLAPPLCRPPRWRGRGGHHHEPPPAFDMWPRRNDPELCMWWFTAIWFLRFLENLDGVVVGESGFSPKVKLTFGDRGSDNGRTPRSPTCWGVGQQQSPGKW